ncbi:hypothetical protein DL93DRAFT_2086747 [Clavulina sp. PMI_390]|nr:hypothetical protein DL93DRAFT_2086747 [Clavulina sp. PMI_390]
MALLNEDVDNDLLRIWGLITELAEQTNANRAMMANIQQQATQAKGQAMHSGTGFVLRRFNTDLSQEVFESELERMNASLIIENQNLVNENKQINALLKEYEQTLETVMGKFRSKAHASQQHELDLTRHYESLLLARDSNTVNQDLLLSSNQSESLARLAHYLRMTIRSLAGEDPETTEDSGVALTSLLNPSSSPDPSSSSQPPLVPAEGYREGGYSGSPLQSEDWALEREIEITRLERENEELRRLLSIGEDEDLMKDIMVNSQNNFGAWGEREGSASPSGSRPASPSPSLAQLARGMPIRRGLLSQNRARMMNGASRMGTGAYTPMPGQIQLQQGGQAQSPGGGSMWGAQDTQRKMGYFKEFPT